MYHSIQCPNCHQQSSSDDVFCVNCGVRLVDNGDQKSQESRTIYRQDVYSMEQYSGNEMEQHQKDMPTKTTRFFRSVAIRMLWALGLTSVFVVPSFGLVDYFSYWSSVTSLVLLGVWLFFVLMALLCYMPSMKRVLSNNSTVASNAYQQEWNMLKDLGVYLFWSTVSIIVSLWEVIGDTWCYLFEEGHNYQLTNEMILMVLFCGFLFSIICIRFGKKDMHSRRFFGVLSGIAVAFVVIFCFALFPYLFKQWGTELWAMRTLLAVYPFTIVLIYVFGPFSMAIKEQKE